MGIIFDLPQRGDYYEQTLRRIRGRTKLPWYLLPPSQGHLVHEALYEGLDAGTVFGPVHDVDETLSTHGFVSVLVPTPRSFLTRADRKRLRRKVFDERLPSLVWINIYTNRDQFGRPADVHWARRVPDETVQTWRDRGWQDQFLD